MLAWLISLLRYLTQPDWVQAIGSLLAIGVSVWIFHQSERTRTRERDLRKRDVETIIFQQLPLLDAFMGDSLNQLTDFPNLNYMLKNYGEKKLSHSEYAAEALLTAQIPADLFLVSGRGEFYLLDKAMSERCLHINLEIARYDILIENAAKRVRLNLEENKAEFVAPFILLLHDIRRQVASLEEFRKA